MLKLGGLRDFFSLRATLTFLLFLFTSIPAFAGWSSSPVSINLNPGQVNDHYNSGSRRIVRVGNTIIALVPESGNQDHTYRSIDGGLRWTEIDTNGTYSGTLVLGKNETVYHFYVLDDKIYMVKFIYSSSPPPPVVIYTDSNLSERGAGAYNMINATVDKDGILYVSTHYPHAAGEKDSLHVIRSEDEGTTWTAPGNAYVIKRGDESYLWTYVHMDFTSNNVLVAVFHAALSTTQPLEFAKSTDKGVTWSITRLSADGIFNPAILTVGSQTIYVFAQSSARKGLVFNKSGDAGKSWSGWRVIDGHSLSGYADPSPGLGSDGTIYVAYRSGARPDLAGVYGGDALRERLAASHDGGKSWSFVDNWFYDESKSPTERTGCRSQIRYQTWYNSGGPLDWIWMQYVDDGLHRPIYFDTNLDVTIATGGGSDETEAEDYRLKVKKKSINKGDGLVESDDGIILCGSVCNGLYLQNAPIILRATPSLGSVFWGWTPPSLNCGTNSVCSLIMQRSYNVKAAFRGPQKLLIKIKSKNGGAGSVTADINGIGAGINCPTSSCMDYYPYGTDVHLTAQPSPGSQFLGWNPGSLKCGANLTCAVPATKKRSVTAVFEGI